VSGRLYSQGKSPWYPLDRRLGGPQSRSGHGLKANWTVTKMNIKNIVFKLFHLHLKMLKELE